CLQSLSQLKKVYKDNWETALDCSDYVLFLGSRSKETLEYMSSMLGKKSWYKKSSGRTYSRQGSSSYNWDIVGRELAFVDELARMESGYGILLVAGMRPFYSKLYDLTKHPRYNELFESWNEKETIKNRYDHSMERGVSKETRKKQQMFRELGLGFVKVKPEFKARDLTKYEERKFNDDAILLSSKSLTDELLNNL
ncbi:MAG: TraM recognition domain-containing protein, partial [Bacilli bacterium]|nr:TraM recognition domain-containing protein [Bacilli bacterium]